MLVRTVRHDIRRSPAGCVHRVRRGSVGAGRHRRRHLAFERSRRRRINVYATPRARGSHKLLCDVRRVEVMPSVGRGGEEPGRATAGASHGRKRETSGRSQPAASSLRERAARSAPRGCWPSAWTARRDMLPGVSCVSVYGSRPCLSSCSMVAGAARLSMVCGSVSLAHMSVRVAQQRSWLDQKKAARGLEIIMAASKRGRAWARNHRDCMKTRPRVVSKSSWLHRKATTDTLPEARLGFAGLTPPARADRAQCGGPGLRLARLGIAAEVAHDAPLHEALPPLIAVRKKYLSA